MTLPPAPPRRDEAAKSASLKIIEQLSDLEWHTYIYLPQWRDVFALRALIWFGIILERVREPTLGPVPEYRLALKDRSPTPEPRP